MFDFKIVFPSQIKEHMKICAISKTKQKKKEKKNGLQFLIIILKKTLQTI